MEFDGRMRYNCTVVSKDDVHVQDIRLEIPLKQELPQPNAKTPFHKNIRIVDNEFHLFDYPILYALSTENLVFSGNKLTRSRQFEPFHKRQAGLTFEFCKKVTISNNTIEGDVLGRDIKLVGTSKNEVKLKDDFFRYTK